MPTRLELNLYYSFPESILVQRLECIINGSSSRGQGHDAFYANTAIKNAYKDYVKAVVCRDTTSPTISAWGLANEAKVCWCSSLALHSPRVTSCVSEMFAYIKTIDKNYLVTGGTEGSFTGLETPTGSTIVEGC
ncbi:hypothetical protein BGX38DRAFT_1125734 [Terfezia claveryi]|nr:hypothetical protein BGX38DRAFT_1125734 [Terfezia claveryi]